MTLKNNIQFKSVNKNFANCQEEITTSPKKIKLDETGNEDCLEDFKNTYLLTMSQPVATESDAANQSTIIFEPCEEV